MQQNILQLLTLLCKYGIKDIVACPGSRNAAIIEAMQRTESFRMYGAVDERAAAFEAIGINDATGEPVAVCVTSGSAILNTIPAVAEAKYRNIPLVIISADRPAEWIDQLDGQTIQQNGCMQNFAPSFNIGEENHAEADWHRNCQLNKALTYCTGELLPVHINIPLREPLMRYDELGKLTKESFSAMVEKTRMIRSHKSPSIPADVTELNLHTFSRPLIIFGQLPHYLAKRMPEIDDKLKSKAIIYAEGLSNMRNATDSIGTFTVEPDLVIYIGGEIVNKPLKLALRKMECETWYIGRKSKELPDLFKNLTHTFGPEAAADILEQIKKMPGDEKFVNQSATAQSIKSEPKEYAAFTKLYDQLSKQDCKGGLIVANSIAVRALQNHVPAGWEICCNRGVNGIEGSLSQAVGYAIGSDGAPTYCVIGDLSMAYNMNATFGFAPENLRIYLVNNGGGKIFDMLPTLDKAQAKPLIKAEHRQQTFRGWAEMMGIKYFGIGEGDEIPKEFVEKERRGAMITEITVKDI